MKNNDRDPQKPGEISEPTSNIRIIDTGGNTALEKNRLKVLRKIEWMVNNGPCAEARHDLGAVPMFETFAYNAWDNTTYRFSESWLNDFSDSASYTNGRRTGWGYDADGRNTSIDTRTYTHDAAGRNIFLNGQRWTPGGYVPTSTASDFDGDGNRIRETSGGSGSMTTTYYLRSSILGAAIVEELSSSGQKLLGYVYTPAGDPVASQLSGLDYVMLKQLSPTGASQYEFFASSTGTGLDRRREFDPVGANVPLNNNSSLGHGGAPGDIPGGGGAYDSRFSAMENPAAGCVLDGVYTPCNWVNRLMGQGALEVEYPYVRMNRKAGAEPVREPIIDYGLGLYGFYAHTFVDDKIESRIEFFAHASGPQNSGPLHLGGTNQLKKLLEQTSKSCREAVQKLLNEIASENNIELTSSDPLELFNQITSQTGGGGIYVDVNHQNPKEMLPAEVSRYMGGPTSSGSGDSFRFQSSSGNWQRVSLIYLRNTNGTEKSIGLAMAAYIVSGFHEITHIAPRDHTITIRHDQMNKAARALHGVRFDAYIEKYCVEKQYWSEP